MIILSVQSNPSSSSVLACWKIIGCVCERFRILALHGTSPIQLDGLTVFFPLTLTVVSNEQQFIVDWQMLAFYSHRSGQMKSEIILSVVFHQFLCYMLDGIESKDRITQLICCNQELHTQMTLILSFPNAKIYHCTFVERYACLISSLYSQ